MITEGLWDFLKTFAIHIFGIICLSAAYWWLRRTRPMGLNLSQGQKKLDEMVEESEREVAEEAGIFVKRER